MSSMRRRWHSWRRYTNFNRRDLCGECTWPVPEPNNLSPQGGRDLASCDEPPGAKFTHNSSPFQDGGDKNSEGPYAVGRLPSKARSEGRLPLSTGGSGAQAYSLPSSAHAWIHSQTRLRDCSSLGRLFKISSVLLITSRQLIVEEVSV